MRLFAEIQALLFVGFFGNSWDTHRLT